MVKAINHGIRKFRNTGNASDGLNSEWNYIDSFNNLVIVSNYKIITDKKKLPRLLFKTQRNLELPHTNKILYHNGSPYYGCSYKYRYCEDYNYTWIYTYDVPILSINKYTDTQTLLKMPNNVNVVLNQKLVSH